MCGDGIATAVASQYARAKLKGAGGGSRSLPYLLEASRVPC